MMSAKSDSKAMPKITNPIAEIAVGRLVVRYFRQSDRIAHSIHLHGQAEETCFLLSIEGDESHAWPVSPPVQEIVSHTTPDSRQALLSVGRSGQSHWSMSVHASLTKKESIEFDIACRCVKPFEWLGSTYSLKSNIQLIDSSRDGSNDQNQIHFSAPDRTRILLTVKGAQMPAVKNDLILRLLPHYVPESYPDTVRWGYDLSVVNTF